MIDNSQRVKELEAKIASLEATQSQPLRIDPDTVYTPAEVSLFLRCGKTNVYDLLTSGDLAVTRVGAGKHGLRVIGADLSAFLQSRKTGGPAPKSAFKYLKIS
jgi:hypothetical protein